MVGRVEIHLQWKRDRNLKYKRRGWKINKKKIIFKIFGPIHHKFCENWITKSLWEANLYIPFVNLESGILFWISLRVFKKKSVKPLFMQTFLSPNFFHRYSNLIFLDDKYFEDNFCVMTSHIQGCPMIIIQLAFFAWNLKQNSARTGRIC